jgi:hypothetical protein
VIYDTGYNRLPDSGRATVHIKVFTLLEKKQLWTNTSIYIKGHIFLGFIATKQKEDKKHERNPDTKISSVTESK